MTENATDWSELEARLARRDRALLAFRSATAAITSSLDLEVVLNTVTREMAALLEMRACALWRWKEGVRELRLLAHHGPEGWWVGRLSSDAYNPLDFSSGESVLAGQQARHIARGQPDLNPDERDFLQQAGLHILLRLPMVYQDRVMGLVEVMDDRPDRAPDDELVDLAHLLANQAASAIENARLYDAVRRYIAEVTTLNRISQVITSILDLGETLAIIADHVLWLLDVAAASVILCDDECGELWFGAASGQGAEFIRGKRLTEGQGIVNWVVQHGEPLLVPDVTEDSRFFSDWDHESGFTTRSILCVPLQTKGRVIGAIEAVNKASGDFDAEDLSLLTSMAASAAIAIENAQLYEQAQQEIAERRRVEAEIRRLYRKLRERATDLEEIVAERTQELRAERDRTQAILEAVGEAVIVTDLEGTIQYLNPAAVELTGYSDEEAVGRKPRLWQPEDSPLRAEDLDAAGQMSMQRGEVVSRRKDGSLYDAAMTVAPLLDSQAADRAVGWVCVQRDITPLKEAERLKDEFVSNVSHELRTPLSVMTLISGNLDRLYDGLDDEQRRKMVRDLRDQADVLNDLVRDILEISRIESGRISMERKGLDLSQLLAREVEKQGLLAENKSQSLEVVGTTELLVWGNANQLRQVIRNLLSNAIKFTPERGRIVCECRALAAGEVSDSEWPEASQLPAGRWAALRVVDTGVGIAEEDLPHLYERFYRVEAQGNVPGTGLGLSIARELVRLHGGRIAAASALGTGSTFAVYVPLWEE